MRQFGAIEKDLKSLHAVVYAISNEEPPDLKRMKDAEKLGDVFVFLSDPNGQAAAKYGGHYANKAVLNPATFVIGRGRRITYAYVDPENYRVRAAAEVVLQAVRDVAKSLRRK